MMDKKTLYKPFVNNTKSNFKYFVYVIKDGKKKKIGFGSKKNQQFHDKLGHYKHLDHKDRKRQQAYLKRSKGIRDGKGNLTYMNKNSSNWFSRNFLW